MLASRQVHLSRGDSEGQGGRLMQSEVLQLRSVAWLLEGHGPEKQGRKGTSISRHKF